MELRAAKRRTWWPALVATAAALLGTAAEASLARNSGRSELLAPRALAASLENQLGANKPRVLTQDLLDQLGSSEGLEQRRPFSLDLDATLAGELVESLQNSLGANKPRVSPRPFGLFARPSRPAAGAGGQDLASALEAVGSEKLASGPKPWEPRLNVWQIQHFASISRWGAVAYARARWYDARNASWLSEDPLGAIDSPNLYQAFGLDPQNNTDPLGLCLFGWSCRQAAAVAADYVTSNVKSVVGYAVGAVDLATLGTMSGNVQRVKTFIGTEGSVEHRAAAAQDAGARQQLNAATMGFAEAPDKLEHASKLFGTAGVKSGAQKIGEGIGSGNFEQIVEGAGEFLGGTGQIAGWAALAYSPVAPKSGPSAPAQGPPAKPNILIDEYSRVSARTDIPGQAHHLNQVAAYRDVIPPSKGQSLKLGGDILRDSGAPHTRAHNVMENFWDQYRGTTTVPTNLQYTRALKDALQASGLSEADVQAALRAAVRERLQYGLLGGLEVPRVPRPIRNLAAP